MQVDAQHARFTSQGREVYLTDLGSKHGTVHNDKPLQPKRSVRLAPGDILRFGSSGKEQTRFLVKMCHNKVGLPWQLVCALIAAGPQSHAESHAGVGRHPHQHCAGLWACSGGQEQGAGGGLMGLSALLGEDICEGFDCGCAGACACTERS